MKKLLLLFALLCMQFNCIKSDCVLDIGSDTNSPYFEVPFGKSAMRVVGRVELDEGNVIVGHCKFGFKSAYFRNNYYIAEHVNIEELRVQLLCTDNNLYYNNWLVISDTKFPCKDPQINYYENVLPWCNSNTSGYTLYLNDIKWGGLCYNFDQAEFNSIYYSTLRDNEKSLSIQTPTKMQSTLESSTIEIQNSHLLEDHIRDKHIELKQKLKLSSKWMKHVKFEIGSILSGTQIENLFDTSMFDILWWPNLRDGNWKRFIEAFEIQSKDKNYDIWSGCSGSLYIPEQKECSKDSFNTTVPVYIWNYLKGRDNDDELLVVGYNSPFSEFLSEKEVIFCEDVCHKYAWLNSTRTSFRYALFGKMFCCDINDVNVKHFLNNFSYNILADETPTTTTTTTTPATPTTPMTTTTTTETTSVVYETSQERLDEEDYE